MEIIIAMAIAFLLGAYIRKPFDFGRKERQIIKPVETAEQHETQTERFEEIENKDLEKQFQNLLNYSPKMAQRDTQ